MLHFILKMSYQTFNIGSLWGKIAIKIEKVVKNPMIQIRVGLDSSMSSTSKPTQAIVILEEV